MSGVGPSPANSKLVGRQFGNQLGPLLMGQRRLSMELCANLPEMQQVELALYALRQGFVSEHISHVELRDKHRVGVLLLNRLEILPFPFIAAQVDGWTRWARRSGLLEQHGVRVELGVLRIGWPVKKQVDLARETLQSPRNRTSDQEASSRLAV